MPEITKSDLISFAMRPDLELLLQPDIFGPTLQHCVRGLTNDETAMIDWNRMQIEQVSRSSNGKPVYDLTFRYPMPDTFPGTMDVHYWGEPPEGRAGFELLMSIRVSEEDLLEGRPDKFVLVGVPELERHSID